MPKVLVLGSSGYDLTIKLERLPRPGETLLGGSLNSAPGGKGANQAIAARRAGALVTFVTAFGDDEFGRIAMANCEAEGLDLQYVRLISGCPNQVALILVEKGGNNVIAVAPGASHCLRPSDIDALPASLFEGDDVLLASLEVPLPTVTRALARAREAGMKTIVNPAPAAVEFTDPTILSLVDLLTPNEEELATLVPRGEMSPRKSAVQWLMQQGVGQVILTLGELGCLVCDAQGQTAIPAPRVHAIDTVGAGDTFSGALATALLEGRSLFDAARWACSAGSIAVTQPGAQGSIPRREQIDLVYRANYPSWDRTGIAEGGRTNG